MRIFEKKKKTVFEFQKKKWKYLTNSYLISLEIHWPSVPRNVNVFMALYSN